MKLNKNIAFLLKILQWPIASKNQVPTLWSQTQLSQFSAPTSKIIIKHTTIPANLHSPSFPTSFPALWPGLSAFLSLLKFYLPTYSYQLCSPLQSPPTLHN